MSSSCKHLISRSFRTISIVILSNVLVAFRIDNHEVGELFFLANNLIILLLRFGVEISEVIGSDVAGRFCLTIYQELRNLATFLEYNSVAFYPD